jgi:hypothetical protein
MNDMDGSENELPDGTKTVALAPGRQKNWPLKS